MKAKNRLKLALIFLLFCGFYAAGCAEQQNPQNPVSTNPANTSLTSKDDRMPAVTQVSDGQKNENSEIKNSMQSNMSDIKVADISSSSTIGNQVRKSNSKSGGGDKSSQSSAADAAIVVTVQSDSQSGADDADTGTAGKVVIHSSSSSSDDNANSISIKDGKVTVEGDVEKREGDENSGKIKFKNGGEAEYSIKKSEDGESISVSSSSSTG